MQKSINSIPQSCHTALQQFIYDGYPDSAHVSVKSAGYASDFHQEVTDRLTGSRMRSLEEGEWHRKTYYYDKKGREIQRVSDNTLGGVSREEKRYDFMDKVVSARESHGRADGGADVFECGYTYDSRGRLKECTLQLNGGERRVIRTDHDRLGRIVGRRYGNYGYNIRGWQTSVAGKEFYETLHYERGAGGAPGRYNGSLSGVEWKNGGEAFLYIPMYDGFDRLCGVESYKKEGTDWNTDASSYTEKGISYDRNGNILSLQRTAGGALVDDLHYSYTGNWLTGLSERIRTAMVGEIYAPGVAEHGTYTYDANGNLTGDSRRGMTYGYNHLNLLKNVDRNGVPVAKYTWLADGTKLRVRDGEGVTGFDYVGSLTYRKDTEGLHLETAHFGEGGIRVDKTGRQEVNYFICDRLGSVRVIVDGAGNILERNDYYPFGARQAKEGYPQLSGNRYKYNGKEEQVTGGLGFLDYGARMYDMSIGRWFGVDPLADRYVSLSGYAFSGNNPLLLVDADGQYFTHYVDKNYDVLFQTDDGSDDVVMVPDEYVGDFKKYAGFSSGMDHIFNSLGWNRFWKDEFGLAERRFSEMELMFLDGFNTGWSRNNAAKYLLNPTIGNLMAMSFSEALSQWTNLELVVTGLNVGIAGLQGMSNYIPKVRKSFFDGTKYTEKVLRQMRQGDFHGFPESVLAFEADGFIGTTKGGDGIVREIFRIPGGYKGRNGHFEFIKDLDGTINHRLFNADL